MACQSNNEKMLEAVLTDEKLMAFGQYTHDDISRINSIYQALESDNIVISTVARIIHAYSEENSESEIYKMVNNFLKNNV